MTLPSFEEFFAALTGYRPRAYQVELARRMSRGELPGALDVPTGMGKTLAVVVAWFYALAVDVADAGPVRDVPMRLHLVSDRRVVVDDTYRAATLVRDRLVDAADGPLLAVVSVLRGHLELEPNDAVLEVLRIRGGVVDDDASPGARTTGRASGLTEHTRHPAVPAIVVGTLDMLCSRLLFRGYQLSPRRRSIDAGLTGADTWWVLDEAHLAPQTMRTLLTLENAGPVLLGDLTGVLPSLRVMAMTATPVEAVDDVLCWDAHLEQAQDPSLVGRRTARDILPVEVVEVDGDAVPALVAPVVDLLENLGRGDGVVVFCTRVVTAKKVRKALERPCSDAGVGIEILMGGMPEARSREVVDRLAGLRTGASDRWDADPVVVVATSTLEVGADLDFTHLVTESADASALIQRLGRVNRIGARRDGSVRIVHSTKGKDPVYGTTAWAVLEELRGATTLGEVVERLRRGPAELRLRSQEPVTIPPTVLGAYTRTAGSRNDPPVTPWIRALEDPRGEVVVVARTEIGLIAEKADKALLEDLAEEPPDARAEGWTVRLADLKDVLRPVLEADSAVVLDPTGAREPRIVEQVGDLATVSPGAVIVVEPTCLGAALGVPDAGRDLSDRVVLPGATTSQIVMTLQEEAAEPRSTILTDLRAEVGSVRQEEVGDSLLELAESIREKVDGVLAVDLLGRDSAHPWLRLRIVAPAAESTERAVTLDSHSADVAALAERWARALGLPRDVVADIRMAGLWHDAGKGSSELFQASLRMREGPDGWLILDGEDGGPPLAKSALPHRLHRRSLALAGVPRGWRHEAASAALLDEALTAEVVRADDAELVRHLVLTHHGYFRGLGPVLTGTGQARQEPYQDLGDSRWSDRSRDFRRLNARYGVYGLALLEAIVRLADWEASRKEQLDD
ncbi:MULTISPECIES: type I-U CRISPR-associated helicase/endonuclease Cas3 [unclassified Actinomyces]|uniref:type I-G CRISPR-associated helicase/endonuclease Cas3g n=1 Tax=unclassified Actinomyces TaxID=2609248 RepID=UPI002018333F|nr:MULTISPECIES: type I-U CRISPR-associated helicase/endonuclease Cas3 [unclassified Actinomyces]MCL3777888.1 type I-U CRISPR-associated helicase/endonuclease Cas3 [Actinomyces sp. AC-20-1]MCL3789231.1 type I-U CRISPR-associated helicase/endonuclease Cas3 [Actinomyces sp. 187325]MCL3791584.1 type I-U CRISPR-associated helicase/endonuclease Cas3 [Actinomyces sp. 186855]MCL3793526.1 type I-U CRISPR-associated helicase/endonuclease Cas3 [Actinomyces sp. 217892]